MAATFIFLLAAYGVGQTIEMIVRGTWFYRKPFICPLCMGFWSALFFIVLGMFNVPHIESLKMCFACAGFSYAISNLVKE